MPETAEAPARKFADPFDLSQFEQPRQAAAPEQAAPVAEAPAPVAPEVPAEAAAPVDPLRQALEGLGSPNELPTWDDNARSSFEKTFGEKDPFAYLESRKQREAEYDIYKKDAEDARALKAGLERISPATQRALQLEMEGKDSIAYLRSLPDAVLQNKPAADLKDEALINTYKPGMVSPEEWEAKRTGEYDELGIDQKTLEYKIKSLRQMAEVDHENKRSELLSEVNKTEQGRQQYMENQTKAYAAAIAHAQSDPITRVFASDPRVLDQFRSGELEKGLLTLDDGITPSPNKLTTLLKAQQFDKAMKLKEEIGYERGLQVGRQEGTSRMPNPSSGTRSNQAQPVSTGRQDVDFLDGIQAAIGH